MKTPITFCVAMNVILEQPMNRILVDSREFALGRKTGIARVLEGLVDALAGAHFPAKILLAVQEVNGIPSKLKNMPEIETQLLPASFLKSERLLSSLSKKTDLYISPYPKLPAFGVHCKAVHIIHDVLDLTHPVYKKRLKVFFDAYRLKKALKRANLTWYDSSWSQLETKKLAGYTGRNPRVRFPGISETFGLREGAPKNQIIPKYGLVSEYILVVGNGLPHKNLGVLLRISNQISRKFVFAGVGKKKQGFWKNKYPNTDAKWIDYVEDEDLPALISNAFCLAQPSTAEGYGYPPLEAMTFGVPAVVSDIPVLKETTGGNALVAKTNESKSWIDAFHVLEDENTYKNQVGKGLEWVTPLLGRNGWRKHISDIEKLL